MRKLVSSFRWTTRLGGLVLLGLIVWQISLMLPWWVQQTRQTILSRNDIRRKKENVKNHHATKDDRFPRWGKDGIHFSDFLLFVDAHRNGTATTVTRPKPRARFPEILYVLRSDGVWVSQTHVEQSRAPTLLRHRSSPVERLFVKAWKKLIQQQQQQQQNDTHPWPLEIPFLAWYGDYQSCNYHNWKPNRSIPLFTNCAPLSCQYAFPIPNYQTILDSLPISSDWDQVQDEYQRQYPWESKVGQLVWRGSLSAFNAHWNSTRWNVVVRAHNTADRETTNRSLLSSSSPLVDIGFTSIGSINGDLVNEINWTLIGGGFKNVISPMADFQRYTAILDVDGNSWSSRFGALLCYNSVVVKVEPQYVEFFHQDLQPWVHYIPVKDDLSDWDTALAFVVNRSNDATLHRIVGNANQWCRQQMTHEALMQSLLHVLEQYVSYLDLGDPDWTAAWLQRSKHIFPDESGWNMFRLHDSL